MIKKTIFSVSTGERNPVHTGVKFEIGDNRIVLVAVDGARLAIRRENIKREDEEMRVMRTATVIATGQRVMITDETHAWYVADDGNIYKPQELQFDNEPQETI